MAVHSKHLTQLKAKLESLDIVNGKNIELLRKENVNKNHESQQIVLNMILHSADVSNPGKPLKVYKNWVNLVFLEFFSQGDIEKHKGLSVSLLCDRECTNISKSQIGFINFIVKPTFECIINLIPEAKFFMENIISNYKYYESLVNEDERKNSSA